MIAGDLNVHRSKLREHVERGYVWVRDTHDGQRADMADPEATCLHPIERSAVPCVVHKGHRGRHSSVAFFCEGCNKSMRGRPFRTAYDPDGVPDAYLCFPCWARGGWGW